MGTGKSTKKAAPKRKNLKPIGKPRHLSKARVEATKRKKTSATVSNAVGDSALPLRATGGISEAIDWKNVHIIGEQLHTEAIKNLHAGPYDFSHLNQTIGDTLTQHPDCDAYLFGCSQSIDFGDDKSAVITGVHTVPLMCIILVRSGHKPPELVAIRDYQRGGEVILPFASLRLKWEAIAGQNSAFALQCMLRSSAMKAKKKQNEAELFKYEYSSLYLLRPSVDGKMDRFGKLDVRFAMFEYASDELENSPISEEFNKDEHRLDSFIPDFLERFDLGEDHYLRVKDAIRAAFESKREENKKKLGLFKEFDPEVLDKIKVVKVYPKNDFIRREHKYEGINQYYGKAATVI